MKTIWGILWSLSLVTWVFAQMPEGQTNRPPSSPPQQTESPPPSSSTNPQETPLGMGGGLPFFDPSTEIISWNGRQWNINDNRIFQARFVKYLNAPEDDSKAYQEYQDTLNTIAEKLMPGRATPIALDEAFRLLPQAAEFGSDARLCDDIANQVYSAWTANRSVDRLTKANEALEEDRKRLEWNSRMAVYSTAPRGSVPKAGPAAKEWAKRQQLLRDTEVQPKITRLAEVIALIKANQLKSEVSSLQSRIEFQSLILHLFLQRRFQHVLIATRFYRNIFADGDSMLRVDGEAKNLFSKTTGLPPTIGTLDALANEAIRDVREGVDAFKFLLEKAEMESASKRLAESFLIGEYMPEIRQLPRDLKRQALGFVQKSNQLLSAIEVKDFTLAENLVKELESSAKDFDTSKPLAVIQTAKTLSAMHLAKAKNAAVSGDRETLESELKAATEIWPRNPALSEVAGLIFSQSDVQQRAIVDFEQLMSQRNYRGIWDDQARFIAAMATHPERQKQLQDVLTQMQQVEGAIMRAKEIEKRGDAVGAWESIEKVFSEFPDDNKLNQMRADLTTKAADFVRTLRTAQELEEKRQYGSSLAWYLKAQKKYPMSDFAREGIEKITLQILPDSGDNAQN